MKDKIISLFEKLSPLLVIISILLVGHVTLDTQMQAIENASYQQCQEALDSNFTMEKGANGWKCVTGNGSYKPEIHLINVPEYPSWLDLAIPVTLALLTILAIPYLPRYIEGGRL